MDKKESYLNGGIGFTPGSTVYTQFNDGIDFLITTDVHIDDMLKAMEKDAMEGTMAMEKALQKPWKICSG